MADTWADSDAYERFMGRWSRLVAPRFLRWLDPDPELRWVDVGCGTGVLTAAALRLGAPTTVLALDPSAGFVAAARHAVDDPRVEFRVGAAEDVPADVADVAVSGLVLNFVPDPARALATMAAAAPHGTVAAYVWDYGGRMQFLRMFWDVACALDARAVDLEDALRFPLCEPHALKDLWVHTGLTRVSTASLEVTTEFSDFEDLWTPFLGGTGSAPSYVASLDALAQDRLHDELARLVHPGADGRIRMHARAWAVQGRTG